MLYIWDHFAWHISILFIEVYIWIFSFSLMMVCILTNFAQGTFLPLVIPATVFQAGLWSIWFIVICCLKVYYLWWNSCFKLKMEENELPVMHPNILLNTWYRCFKLWPGIGLSAWMHLLLLHRGHTFVSFQFFSLCSLSISSGIALSYTLVNSIYLFFGKNILLQNFLL